LQKKQNEKLSKNKIYYFLAVIPYLVWESIQNYIDKNTIKKVDKLNKEFNPGEFKGILKNLNLDIDKEIQNLRNE
jgi:hypothetical protein